jgi:kynurenine formamidase
MHKHFLVSAALFMICGVTWAQKPDRVMIDLTYPFNSETIYWPTAEDFRLKTDAEGINDKGYYYSAYSFAGAEHGGTHMDAPIHFAQGMPTIDQVPLDRVVAQGILIDVQKQAAADRDYQIRPQDLTDWEKANGRIPDGSIVMLRTGWGRFYPDKLQYLGTDKKGQVAVSALHFPGLSPAAAQWIVANRKISAVAIDTASIDYGQSQLFETHRILYKEGIFAIENVARMDALPVKGFEIIALPMKIQGGSGAPVRIIAILS